MVNQNKIFPFKKKQQKKNNAKQDVFPSDAERTVDVCLPMDSTTI